MSAATPATGPRRHPALRVSFDAEGELRVEVPSRQRALRASPEVVAVLGLCDGRPIPEIAAALGSRLGDTSPAAAQVVVETVLGQLESIGALVTPVPSGKSRPVGYAHPWIHRAMIGDFARTEAFRLAIEARVRPGDVVIDVGCGTGILSLFAARAGAKEVHAIEQSALADYAQELAKRNGFGDVITVHAADAAAVELDVQADVLVSEWLGQMVVHEGMFPAVAAVRDRWLKPGGHLIPSTAELFLAPLAVSPTHPEAEPAYWCTQSTGFDLSLLMELELEKPMSRAYAVDPKRLLAPGASLGSRDCHTTGANDLYWCASLDFEVERDDTLVGFCGWFTCELAPGVLLDTSPAAPLTHWEHHVFACRPRAVKAGERLSVELAVDPDAAGPGLPIYTLTCGDERMIYDSPA